VSTNIRFPLRESPYLKGVRIPFVAFMEDALSADLCDQLIQRIEAHSPTVAPINVAGGAVLNTNVRNNDRVIFDDAALAADLFARTQEALPTSLDGGKLVGYNERFRGYRYRGGQRFAPHFDGAYFRPETPTGRDGSQITVLFYLNGGFEGGETKLLDYEVVITPKRGSVLFFTHAILHEGCAVTAGVKYVLRSDAMYRFPAER
jgi:predicted 2-oxoglutarate/Fe(II)-dependent dioxygenase YbiX